MEEDPPRLRRVLPEKEGAFHVIRKEVSDTYDTEINA
jgi:hypothetical protein